MAYKKYDSNKNTKFSTFAYPYIFGEINKCFRSSKPLKISKDITSLANRIEKVKSILAQEYGRYPTDLEVMAYLSIGQKEYNTAIESTNAIFSLDYTYEDDISFYDMLGKTLDLDTMIMLKEELAKMPELDRKIFLSHYLYDLTQQEIANKFGINQVAVSRNYGKTLKRLRVSIR